MKRSTVGVLVSIVAGAVLGTAVWYVRTEPRGVERSGESALVAVTPPERVLDHGTTNARVAAAVGSPSGLETASREARPRLDPPHDEREDPRDPAWAAPMEQLFEDVAAKRVRELMPEANWVGVTCRSRGCTVDFDCPDNSGEMCQMLANILVVVDGMRLHIRQQPADENGRFHVLVDIELPDGDASALRRSIEREQQLHPEYVKRLTEAIAMSRRDREALP